MILQASALKCHDVVAAPCLGGCKARLAACYDLGSLARQSLATGSIPVSATKKASSQIATRSSISELKPHTRSLVASSSEETDRLLSPGSLKLQEPQAVHNSKSLLPLTSNLPVQSGDGLGCNFGTGPVTNFGVEFCHASMLWSSGLLTAALFLALPAQAISEVTADATVSADGTNLIQDLQNIVTYAMDYAQTGGTLGAAYFTLAYILATVLFLPASVLTIGAGFIFGTLKGTAIVSAASTTGASLAFLIARYVARPFVERQLIKFDKFELVDRALAKDGWKIVFLWRLSPLFPFALSNYMFGLTGVSFLEYVAASWVAMLPATFTYVYLGSASRATVDVVSGSGNGEIEPIKVALYVIGAIATLLVTREVSSRATKALEEAGQVDVE